MQFKKLTSLLLISVVTLSLSGCKKELPQEASNTSSDTLAIEDGAKLNFWTENVEYGKKIAAGFMKQYPSVKVEVQEVGMDAPEKLALDGPSGKGGDVFVIPYDKIPKSIASGIVEPLHKEVSDNINKKVQESAVKTATHDGKLYGVPISIETMSLFYNKDVVGDKPVTSMEGLVEYSKTYNDKRENKYALLYKVADGYPSYPILNNYGYNVFGTDGTDREKPGFDSSEYIKGLEYIASLHDIMPMNSEDLNEEFVSEQFKSGKTPYLLENPWRIQQFKDAGVNFGLSQLPTLNGKPLKSFGGAKIALVSAYSKYPQAANLFAKYLASDDGAKYLYEVTGQCPAIKDFSKIEGLKDDEMMATISKQFETSIPVPTDKRVSYYWTISEKSLAMVFNGDATPQEASKKAMEEWNTLLQSE